MSEFGKGFTYCIGLFLMHVDRITSDKEIYAKINHPERAYEMWFNAAADHLYELQIPDNFKLKKECENWQNKCIEFRLSHKVTEKDFTWALEKARQFLRAWDKQMGIDVMKGDYE